MQIDKAALAEGQDLDAIGRTGGTQGLPYHR